MQSRGGLILFIGAMGMMATLMAGDIEKLSNWSQVYEPVFVAKGLAHFGAVIAAYVGGKVAERNK